jgi:pimeloyl-ACP methyl ester carboxylesterase
MVEHLSQHSFRQLPDGRWINKLDRRTGRRVLAFDGIQWMRKVTCPVLVVRAGRSTMVEREALERLVAASQRGYMVEIADADHQVILDSADQIVKILREFLDRCA